MKRRLTAEVVIKRMIRLKAKETPDFFKLWGKLRLLLFKTKEYQEWREIVRAKSSHMCAKQGCRKRGRECHHIIRVYDDPTLSLDPENGLYLCLFHHKKEHSNGTRSTVAGRSSSRKQPSRHQASS